MIQELEVLDFGPRPTVVVAPRIIVGDGFRATGSHCPDAVQRYPAVNPVVRGGVVPARELDFLRTKSRDFLLDAKTGLYMIQVPEVVLGNDDRVRIPAASAWPYSPQGRLLLEFPKGDANGSGALVSTHHVLTAAHNVYVADYGGWIKEASFASGASGDGFPFGTAKVVRCYCPKAWVLDQSNEDYDYAIMVLDRPVGALAGHMGMITYQSSENLLRRRVAVAGYPGDLGGKDPYLHVDAIKAVGDARFSYDIDTAKGQSGAVVFARFNDNPLSEIVVGVHTTGHFSGNGATRLSTEVFDTITSTLSK